MRRSPMNTEVGSKFAFRALWFVVFVGTAYLAIRRYDLFKGVIPKGTSGPGNDFWQFLHAARLIAAGHNPYDFSQLAQGNGYVYSPLIALLLVPFAHAATVHIWHVWTVLSIAAVVLFAGLVTMVEAPILIAWRRPVLFGFTVVTAFQFMPTTVELNSGQVDTFVLVLLAASVLVLERGWRVASGVLIGLSAVVKTWPGGAALSILRRGRAGRSRALVGLVMALVLAPVLALAIGGKSRFVDFVKMSIDARSQHLASLSVWGVPKLLFSHSGLARPILVLAPLQDIATLVLVLWVIGLLVLALRWSDSSVLCFWNVVACVVLLLPVSHLDYTMYLLPILWIWVARWLTSLRFNDSVCVTAGLLMLWWIATFDLSPVYLSTVSSLRFSVTFFANLAAVTVSVLEDRHRTRCGMASGEDATDARVGKE